MEITKEINFIQVEALGSEAGTPGTFVITAECEITKEIKAGVNFWVYIPELFRTDLHSNTDTKISFQEVSIDYFTNDEDADWERGPSIFTEEDMSIHARRDEDNFYFRLEVDKNNLIVSLPIKNIGNGEV